MTEERLERTMSVAMATHTSNALARGKKPLPNVDALKRIVIGPDGSPVACYYCKKMPDSGGCVDAHGSFLQQGCAFHSVDNHDLEDDDGSGDDGPGCSGGCSGGGGDGPGCSGGVRKPKRKRGGAVVKSKFNSVCSCHACNGAKMAGTEEELLERYRKWAGAAYFAGEDELEGSGVDRMAQMLLAQLSAKDVHAYIRLLKEDVAKP